MQQPPHRRPKRGERPERDDDLPEARGEVRVAIALEDAGKPLSLGLVGRAGRGIGILGHRRSDSGVAGKNRYVGIATNNAEMKTEIGDFLVDRGRDARGRRRGASVWRLRLVENDAVFAGSYPEDAAGLAFLTSNFG